MAGTASILAGASNITISGSTFSIRHGHSSERTLGFDKLTQAAAHSALHDAPARTDETRCHRHTRVDVLDHLERWAQGICEEGASVFWLYGGAGAGKSTIMQTIAERCAAQGLTLGSFFFSRTDLSRDTSEVLAPTLAYQLAQLFPSSMKILGPAVNQDPLVFKKSLQVQFISLLLQPLQQLVELGSISDAPYSPRVFLIDGPDECKDPVQQQAIIKETVGLCHEHHIPVKFLIASRPELAISTSFECYKEKNCFLGIISLSKELNAAADIRHFIEAEFLKIHLQHAFRRMIPFDWPCAEDVNKLVQNSSSHFIYASTAMKFIWSAKESPVRSLQVILGLQVSRTVLQPFSKLDALYHHILGSAEHLDKVLQILAHLCFTLLPSFPSVVCIVLKCSLDDLRIYLADITSLVSWSQTALGSDAQNESLQLLHASLGDFLSDQSRSGSLYIDQRVYCASKLKRYFQLLNLYSHNESTIPAWPQNHSPESWSAPNIRLSVQIVLTISDSGHLPATQDVLKKYNFANFYVCQLYFPPEDPAVRSPNIYEFFTAVQSIETFDGKSLFRHTVEDFFDILEWHLGLDDAPLAPAILPLIFLGYSSVAVSKTIRHHFKPNRLYDIMQYQWPTPNIPAHSIAPGELGSRHTRNILAHSMAHIASSSRHCSVHISPERLALAAEALLGWLINQAKPPYQFTFSVHKAWHQRKKPGKYIATGAPRLASTLPALCRSLHAELIHSFRNFLKFEAEYTRGTTLVAKFQFLATMLGGKYHILPKKLERRQVKLGMVVNLLEALLWVLPKASYSDKILLYAKRAFPRNMYQHKPGLVCRVRKCLDQYTTRVQKAQVDELDQKIDNGDVNALIEKSRVLCLDAQD